ncbi:DNA-binding transcriptional activator UhpA [Legionella massiliensis]|uniref:DNA-binding transcriptional activator UhpA n=1 Tax=Legionella massiliensis TaxID=1034943 RepID=A0A078KVB7_9GAMM|nr:LuxR C-terminal-related transcriptional regulator [Legionella massiliensis]CDZ78385.1 DNA-binding transcriptional activator UhpA [Legionella massiliensis]CEE14123.1 Transcriptional regulatory protein UhpA [Legionella massiliensis]
MIIDFELLNMIPGAIGFKDKNSVYLGGNQLLASTMGFAKPQDIVGMKDTDIKSEMVVFADKFVKEDKEVMLTGERQHIDIGRYNDGLLRATLSTKKVILAANQAIIGTAFSRVELKSSILKKLLDKSLNIKFPLYYTIARQYGEYNLNKRETESLFYLMRGYTAKEIAQRLGLSPKTIEYHIEQLKNKLGCSKKSELVEKSIDLGFLYNIPTAILSAS